MIRTYVHEDTTEEEAKKMAWELVQRGFHILSIEEHNFERSGLGYLIVVDTEGVRSTRLPEIKRLPRKP